MAIKELEYQEIENYVMAFQNNDEQAGLDILENCKGFTDKFKNLICYGKVDLSNRSIRGFINMFIPKHVNAQLGRHRKSGKAWADASTAAEIIKQKFYMYEEQEVDSIIATVLLGLAKKYKNNGRNNFYAYITSCFHFRLIEHVMILVDDLTNLCYYHGNEYHENLIESSTLDTYNLNSHSKSVNSLIVNEENDEVGSNWLLGDDCEIFNIFTPYERKILMLKYVYNLSDEEVGENLGVCRHTIYRRKLKLLAVLKEHAIDIKLLKG